MFIQKNSIHLSITEKDMKVLNLTIEENDYTQSDIHYKISCFPDGQRNVTVTEPIGDWIHETVEIRSRMTTFRDLELIICAAQDLYGMGVKTIELYVPYFLGSRSDRKFETGSTNYLKNVICPIINSQNFSKVTVLDAHSDVLEACLNNYEKRSNIGVVRHALIMLDDEPDNIVLVSPDAGALKKVYDVAKSFNITNVVTAGKVRNIETGQIVRTEVPDLSKYVGKRFLIVDDICDGGRTFIELAKAIQEQLPSAKCYLCVTHGIFSAGLKELNKYFNGIFCTNSYSDMDSPEFSLANDNHMHKLFQMNVF